MTTELDFKRALESKVMEQLKAQRVGYLLGAGSSYLDNTGYPLTFELWDLIKDSINVHDRTDIQLKLDEGASGIEQALDLLDDGGANDTPYRHSVTSAIADLFRPKNPNLDLHVKFVKRLSRRTDRPVQVFSLNYDPLIERAAEFASVRLSDGFLGVENAYFAPEVFEERIGRIRGDSQGTPIRRNSEANSSAKAPWFARLVRMSPTGHSAMRVRITPAERHQAAHGASTASKSN